MAIGFKSTEELRAIRERKKAAVDRAFGDWEARKLPLFQLPEREYPQIPENITDWPNPELEQLMAIMRIWDAYIAERMVEAKTIKNTWEATKRAVESRVIHELRLAYGESLEKRRVAVRANVDYMEADERYESACHAFSMLEMRHKQISRDLAVVSRIVELRKLEQRGRGSGEDYPSDINEGDRYAED